MVILLDKKEWNGGDFLCQYTGKNVDVYRKKPFKTPIINVTPKYRGGIILRNNDTRHMVTKIIPIPKINATRSVIVLQLYSKIYGYD